jgi:hypothetical protein
MPAAYRPRCEHPHFLGWNYSVMNMQLILMMCAACGAVVGAVPRQT